MKRCSGELYGSLFTRSRRNQMGPARIRMCTERSAGTAGAPGGRAHTREIPLRSRVGYRRFGRIGDFWGEDTAADNQSLKHQIVSVPKCSDEYYRVQIISKPNERSVIAKITAMRVMSGEKSDSS